MILAVAGILKWLDKTLPSDAGKSKAGVLKAGYAPVRAKLG